MLEPDSPLVRFAIWMATVTALVIAIAPPAGYLYFGYRQQDVAVAAEIEIKARQISQLINSNPDYWRFEKIRIDEFFRDPNVDHLGDSYRIIDRTGEIITQIPDPAPVFNGPVLSRQRVLSDYGEPIARIEVTRSLRELYSDTALFAVFSVLAGLLIYWGLRVLPLRALTRALNRVAYLATHDALTELPNRTTFLDQLQHVLADAPRSARAVTVHCLDLDHFKNVNDTLGHAAGDDVLKLAAQRMQANLRHGDTLACFGGGQFAIIQRDTEKPETAAALAERIIAELAKPFDLDGGEAVVSVSIGMAMYTPDNPLDADELIQNAEIADKLLQCADLALHRAKELGLGGYHFFEPALDLKMQQRRTLEADLRKALKANQFELHYQPLVSLTTQKVCSVEALIRWRHPERGMISPLDFIPLAEETGLIVPIGEWVIRQACATVASWPGKVRVAVNLSSVQFKMPGLVPTVVNALAAAQLDPRRLELEITESLLLEASDAVLATLHQLRALGATVALDDFGTGYSSLSYLQSFPFDKLKIDRSFIKNLGIEQSATDIVKAIVALAQALEMSITAEGIETEQQLDLVRACGCSDFQGYLCSKPRAAQEIEALLLTKGWALETAA